MRVASLGIVIMVAIAATFLSARANAQELSTVRKLLVEDDAIKRSIEILGQDGTEITAYRARAEKLDQPADFGLRLTEAQKRELRLTLRGKVYWMVRIDVLNDAENGKKNILWTRRILIDADTGKEIFFPTASRTPN
ncbi:hypothetical protein GCM10027277_49840 [Pseudoduganella ginsengisoli]|uniref:PepSY domain-containing protein n=1 Tax=Pseudoduganella ginsengisoli TaxID=1462440 RepID=A0A6L6Q457_9BURK|nr:hypothetical protein [Pseudoduganella ginsengisoli]MTW04603.1 hypothetical protein [Pseudoduganella ginsengisoli]